MTQQAPTPSRNTEVPAGPGERSRADLFMRRLLRVTTTDPKAVFRARSAMRSSIVIAGIRCTITYLLVPILVPILGFMGTFATPLSIALILYAMVNGVISVRRFWMADHRSRWNYTWFMAIVLLLLTVALVIDVITLAAT